MPKEKSSKIRQLARKFAFEKEQDEKAWAYEICETPEHSTSYVWHRALLRRMLLDRLFNLEIRTGSARRKAMYRSQKSVFMVEMLLMLGARRTAMSLVPVAMKRARKFELTADRIALLGALCNTASLNGWRLKFQVYDRELREAMGLRSAEIEVTSLVQRLNVESVGRATPSKRARRLARTVPRQARILFRTFPTFTIGLAYYRIAMVSAHTTERSELGLSICEEAQSFLSGFPTLQTDAVRGEFEVNRLWFALSSHAFEAAQEAVRQCGVYFPEGTNNWFIAKEFEFLLQMHTKKWTESLELHKSIAAHARFTSQPEQVREKWSLFGQYATFVHGELMEPGSKKKTFGKVVREIPIYSRDKAGYNASLLILQQLVLAARGDHDGMIKKSDALAQYMYRHLRDRHDGQLYAFMKTLHLLQKYEFDVEKVRVRAGRFIEQFEQIGREKVDETQVLPFGFMWDLIADWVKRTVFGPV